MKRIIIAIAAALLSIVAPAYGQMVFNNPSGQSFRTSTEFGHNGVSSGQAPFSGATSGTTIVQVPAVAGSYNYNLPLTAGTSGQAQLSGGGGAAAQTYGTLGVAAGGTGAVTAQTAMAALKGVYVLGASAVQVTHTGDTSEFTLATIAVPANAMGANGVLRITAQMGYSGGTGNWTPRIKFNGTAYLDPTQFGATSLSGRIQTQIANRNLTNSQVGTGTTQVNWAGTTSAPITSAHDTTGALNITITGQLTALTDTVKLESYLVELIVP